MSAWVEYVVTVLALLVAFEVGYRLSLLRFLQLTPDQRTQVGAVVAAMLAVLGFVLAFSFSIVEARFAARRAMVVKEANAIGTAYLRTDFLPSDESAASKELYRSYLDLRLSASVSNLSQVLETSGEIHQKLWALARRAVEQDPHSISVGLYVQALNAVIDVHEERLTAAVRNRLPELFLWILYGTAVLAVGTLGFSTGQTDARNLIAVVPLIAVICALLWLICDLDRPDLRMIKVGQGAMQDLQQSMRVQQPSSP